MQRIIALYIVFQSPASPRARKNIVRKMSASGPMREREVEVRADIEIGAGSNANSEVRRVLSREIRRNVKAGEAAFYVKAEIERTDRGKLQHYFKTVVPRSLIDF